MLNKINTQHISYTLCVKRVINITPVLLLNTLTIT